MSAFVPKVQALTDAEGLAYRVIEVEMDTTKKSALIHWLIPGKYPETSELFGSTLASIRMRAGLVAKNVRSLGIGFTAGDDLPPESQLVVVGKIGADCLQGRANHWLTQLRLAKETGKHIVLDYTDHHLAKKASPMRLFYAEVLSSVDEAVVSSNLMKSHLECFFSGPIHVIPDPLEIPITPPAQVRHDRKIKTILWFGHATNIKYLISYLSDHGICDADFKLIVLSNDPGLQAFASQAISVKGNVQVNLLRWSVEQTCAAARLSDACIIPSDRGDPVKSGASSNRLLTALALGLPTLAENLASYSPFSAYYTDIRQKKLSDFFGGLSHEVCKVSLAQRDILPDYTQEALMSHWANLIVPRA